MRYKQFKITKSEYEHIKKVLKRDPNDFELHLFSATYSEHCSYKHSKELLKKLPRKFGKNKAIYYTENAGGIKIGEHAILFKMESHNHPCAVEPFNGAATGVGGIIRDVLAMNARPIALCNSLRFAKTQDKKSKHIINGVVEGISTYGNSIGVPTVSTEVLLDDCYGENPLVNVTAIGIAKEKDILTSDCAKPGLKLMLVGSDTMRDGMGGAAFASKELSDEKKEDKLSIQIANPFMKKKLIEACLEIFSKKLVVSCQDCGAAGILSSTSEVAFKSNCGVILDLAQIHIGDKTIKDFEIMLSETQERMVFVIEDDNALKIAKILKKYELNYSIFGEVIKDKKYVIKNKNTILANLPTRLLVTPPKVKLDFSNKKTIKYNKDCHAELVSASFELSELDSSRNEFGMTHNFINGNSPLIYEQYDHTVGVRTQLQPSDNPQFNSLWLWEENCSLGIYTFCSIIEKAPYKTVYDSIIDAAEELLKREFIPVGITNCLNFANPEIAPTMYEFRETITAMEHALKRLKIPVCSGNVSFYNEHSGGKIKNTPTFTMIGIKKLS